MCFVELITHTQHNVTGCNGTGMPRANRRLQLLNQQFLEVFSVAASREHVQGRIDHRSDAASHVVGGWCCQVVAVLTQSF